MFFDLAWGMCQKWYDLISILLCSWSLYLDHVVWDWVKEKSGKQSKWVISVICTQGQEGGAVSPAEEKSCFTFQLSVIFFILHPSFHFTDTSKCQYKNVYIHSTMLEQGLRWSKLLLWRIVYVSGWTMNNPIMLVCFYFPFCWKRTDSTRTHKVK